MKNGKKILILAVALSVLCALMCVNAFAAEEPTISAITKKVNNVEFEYGENAVNFGMTYSGDEDGMFLVLVLDKEAYDEESGEFAPQAKHILYVNQTTSSDGKVSFTDDGDNVIYPSGIENESMVCLAGAGLNKIKLLGVITANQVEPEYPRGDVNQDRSVDYGDIQRLYQHLSTDSNKLTGLGLEIADVNEDDSVDYGDIQRLYQHLSTDNKLPQ